MNTEPVAVLLVALFVAVSSSRMRIVFDPATIRTFTMPESCKSKGMEYCFSKENYPTDIVQEILEDVKNLVVDNGYILETGESFSNRLGEPSIEHECSTSSRNDTIYYIVDEFGKDRVVVQKAGRFQQWFNVKYCTKEGAIATRTQHFMQHTVLKYNMSCQNRYIHYDFLVLSTEPDLRGKWNMEKARTKTGIPVCCACTYDKQ